MVCLVGELLQQEWRDGPFCNMQLAGHLKSYQNSKGNEVVRSELSDQISGNFVRCVVHTYSAGIEEHGLQTRSV